MRVGTIAAVALVAAFGARMARAEICFLSPPKARFLADTPVEASDDPGIRAGNEQLAAGGLDEAVDLYRAALACRPDRFEGWFNLGLTQLKKARQAQLQATAPELEAAIDALTRAVRLRPEHTGARELLLVASAESGRVAEVAPLFLELARTGTRDNGITSQIAQVQGMFGDYRAAVALYALASEVDEDPVRRLDALYAVGVLSWKQLQGHREVTGMQIAGEGIAALERSLAGRPLHMPTLAYLGLLHEQRAAYQPGAAARDADLALAKTYKVLATGLRR